MPHIELHKVKIHPDLSDETTCFSAEILVDGVLTATVKNEGHGGSNDYWAVDPTRYAALEQHALAQPPHVYGKVSIPTDLDQYIDDLLAAVEEEQHQKKWLKRNCKNKTVFRLKGDPAGTWRTVKHVYDEVVKQHMAKKYGDRIEVVGNEIA